MFPSTTSTSTVQPADLSASWAGDVAGPSPEATGSQPLPRNGVRGLAAAMVAGPIAMTAWFLVEPAVLPREEPTVFLSSVAAAPGRYLLATAFLTLAGALAIPAALGVGRLLRPRMPRLAALLVVTMSLSGLGLWAQAGFRSFVVSMVLDGTVPRPPSRATPRSSRTVCSPRSSYLRSHSGRCRPSCGSAPCCVRGWPHCGCRRPCSSAPCSPPASSPTS